METNKYMRSKGVGKRQRREEGGVSEPGGKGRGRDEYSWHCSGCREQLVIHSACR